ncbi:Pyridine nucleotide-disulphide oxidoreductase [Tenacibaculum sp. MAR_2009_124]|uniref:NAD(P)-binding protein n=1 Tax=Tenacibaculum sp. MAR_2009_124 TaxID=1250059 RepID=UPI0008985DAD|nr:NAD(P)-binding protein [Tenacibaculum sp. MAR_2009_124]SEB45312.1 Pyridine nucleotide-disulphide oxidoreductase [Tenacibaculum sp. MAR_2009_124]
MISPLHKKIHTDYLIIGAGAMGLAFADEMHTQNPHATITIIDRRPQVGGHWNNAYPYVMLHQPAAYYGVNSSVLGNGSTDLSSKTEILTYFNKTIEKLENSGKVTFLGKHNYLGNGKVENMDNLDEVLHFNIRKKIVNASYMKVEVPSTTKPKYLVDEGVPFKPLNDLVEEYKKWKNFYIIGNGKTGIDAVLYLIGRGIKTDNIHWITPSDAWYFNRDIAQVGCVSGEILTHVSKLTKAQRPDDIFLEMEKSGGIMRIDTSSLPTNWRCATVSTDELTKLRSVTNIIQKGYVNRITSKELILQEETITYKEDSIFIDCTANGLAKLKKEPVFSGNLITLQPILFCQQVFSAAAIARLELVNISEKTKNKVIPIPHPEKIEDWPRQLSVSVDNLLRLHKYFPLWMYHSRLNFMSYEPILKYFGYAIKAAFLSKPAKKAVKRLGNYQ